MRVTQSTIVQQFIYNLQQNEQSILNTENELSTGKRLLQPQDNPGGAAIAMQYQAGIDMTTQYLSNDQTAQSWLTASGNYLQTAGSVLQQVQSLGLELGGPQADVPAISSTLASLQGELLSVANAQFNGQYLFAGTDVTGATTVIGGATVTTPYATMAGTTYFTSTAGTTVSYAFTSYVYAGNGGAMSTEIEPATHMQVNVQGSVFTKALNDVSSMVGALQAGYVTLAATTLLTNVQNDLSQIETTQAVTGSWQQRLTQNTQSLQTVQTNLKTQLGNTQNVDIASAIVNLQQEQNAYQSALGVGAMIQQTTLLNYLHP